MAITSSLIAIVGGGASGTLLAAQVLRQAVHPTRVVLYDLADIPGRGVAYGTADTAHLLNVPAGRMSALPGEPNHFLDWLNAASNCASLVQGGAFTAGDFVPRAIYGRYLSAFLEEAIRHGRGHNARFEHRRERIVDLIPRGAEGATLVMKSADTEDVAQVVLALGNQPPRDPLPRTHAFFHSRRYLPYIWAPGVLEGLSPTEDILIVGSGLTALDVVAGLYRRGHEGKITITSRNGRLPQEHATHPPYGDFLADREWPATARGWCRLVRAELAQTAAQGIDWRPVLDSLRPHSQKAWVALPVPERRRFMRHLRSFWESHRHRAPQSTYLALQDLSARGQLQILPGRVREFEEHSRRVDVLLQEKGKAGLTKIPVQRVLNCIGPESNFLHHLNDPLIVNLMARGVLQPDALLIGLEATVDGRLIGLEGTVYNQISTLGPPLRGVLWETTAIPEIRVQAEKLAARMLSEINVPSWQI